MDTRLVILIVDDLKDNRLAIKIALKKEDYILEEAVNGMEAVTKCNELEPDIILMDALMPVMDGYEATRVIRAIEKFNRTPILMITALSEKEDMIKALEVGVNDFISKPFDKNELITRCRSYVNFSKINKQYILASKNPDSNLPNKIALFNDLKQCQNPKLILFKIENYKILVEFYGIKVAKKIKFEFIKTIFNFIPSDNKKDTLYNTDEGEFALLKDDKYNTFKSEKVYQNCNKFYKKVKKSVILLKNYEYDISIVLSYANNTKDIFENAKLGLNHAIKQQINVIFADEIVEQVHQDAENNIKTIKMIKTALSDKKILSFFQPIYNNKTKEIEKYESLVRLIDENDKTISPFFFLNIAKKGKYYTQITERVLHNSFETLKLTTKDISINISATDIEDENTRNMILDFCENNQKLAKRVVFELLEDENFKDFNFVKEFIKEIKSYGASIAIDDFGSGYSSFERLLDFQPDILKIDGSLIKNIEECKFSRNIVETIQDFATKMDIKTVAEFVSNEKIFKIVNEIGIDYTQGYYIDEPRPVIK